MENDIAGKVREVAERARAMKGSLQTEEATKTGLVMPLFAALGYNVFDPGEFCPEFTADVGVKKGEKVDYAILQDGKPRILVEVKCCGESLDNHGSQLFRYFGATKAKFGILTDGVVYRFFTDLDDENVMDLKPFLEVNLLDLSEIAVSELSKFAKPVFDPEQVFSRAEELKYSRLIKEWLTREMEAPSDEFVRLILGDVYEGLKTQKVIEQYKPLVKRVHQSIIDDLVDDLVKRRLSAALEAEREATEEQEAEAEAEGSSKIVTTEEEIEAFHIIRGMLADEVPASKVAYRDTESYFSVLYDDNNRKPICRLYLDGRQMYMTIPDEEKDFTRHDIDSLEGIFEHRDELAAIALHWHEQS